MTLKIGYVVLHYVFRDLTDACLESIAQHASGAPVLVVDNGSPTAYTASVPILRLAEGRCLSAAMNAGTEELWRSSLADIAVQLNNDIVLTRNTQSELAWAFESRPRLGLAAPMMDEEDSGFMFHPCPYPPGEEAEVYLASSLPSQQVTEPPFLDNAAWAIRRETWSEVGGLEERFSSASWGANFDYCWRARSAGWQIGLVRSAFVFHRHSATWNRLDPEYDAHHAAIMMDEMRAVWGEVADIVSCREFVWKQRADLAAKRGKT